MSNNIQELFTAPVGLEVVMVMNGFKLYSSSKIRKEFIQSMKKTNEAKIINPVLERLVDDELVLPCFQNSGLVKNLKYKLFGDKLDKSISGFFSLDSSKVVILIDNEINLFGFSSNRNLAVITLHECTHMFASRKPSAFISLFRPELETYYSSAFTNIFKLNSKIKNIGKIVKFIFSLERSKNITNDLLIKYHKLLESEFLSITSFSKKDFDQRLRDFITLIKISIVSISTLRRIFSRYSYIIGPLYTAYKDTFRKPNNATSCFQELTIPSEVMCVGVEIKPSSKNVKAFKMLS